MLPYFTYNHYNDMNWTPEIVSTDRVWIFTAQQKLDAGVLQQVQSLVNEFVSQWKAHGQQLNAKAIWVLDQVMVIAVDRTAYDASGCAIDALNHHLADVDKQYNLGWFDRSQLFTYDEASQQLHKHTFTDVGPMLTKGQFQPTQKVLVHTLSNGADVTQGLIQPLHDSPFAHTFRRELAGLATHEG